MDYPEQVLHGPVEREAAYMEKTYKEKTAGQTHSRAPAQSPLTGKTASLNKPAQRKQREAIKPLRTGRSKTFPIVGIGASAGGLEAFKEFLQNLPTDTGLGFVLVQHLDPTHESILANLLAKATDMPVREAKNKLKVEPNHVYVIPPNTLMTIKGGILKLAPEKRGFRPHRSIDHFLTSLADDQGVKAIGVVLSGSATDGTLGLEAIKEHGGITFAQDEQSAKYSSMPRSAVASGCVDFVLPSGRIAQEIAGINRHAGFQAPPAEHLATPIKDETNYKKIMAVLRLRTGVDFSHYKPSTINRRIARRMVLNKVPRLSAYVPHLRNPAEVEALYQDVLISVTGFFRDESVFEVFKNKYLPRIVKNRTPDQPVRAWVLGCSTGQEAYSLAMIFLEYMSRIGRQIPLQIFATELNERLLEKARQGVYSKTQVEGISPERLRRFFVEEEGGFRLCKPVREMCVFARHNALADPPFSKMDIVSCRNLMIYLEPVLQKRLVPDLHYALVPGGLLILGASENISGFSSLFSPEDKTHKFYMKNPSLLQHPVPVPASHGAGAGAEAAVKQKAPLPAVAPGNEFDLQKEADRVVAARYGPAGVLVNESLQILQFRGKTSPYLAHLPGKASFDLLKMLREGLFLPVRTALQKVKRQNKPVRVDDVKLHQDGRTRRLHVEVIPVKNGKEIAYLVSFVPAGKTPIASQEFQQAVLRQQMPRDVAKLADENVDLRNELTAAREFLQSVTEQYEVANEELQAANEEGQSSNEELQSINEELQTTKEELESTNEELITVNEEMSSRNVELHQLNNDLNNVLSGVSMCIVVLDGELCIRRFTPLAEKLMNLVPTDAGRPITNIKPNIEFPGLEQALAEVINSVRPKTQEVQDKAGKWYLLRLLPYKTFDRKVEGALLVLVDIDTLKRTEGQIQAARDYAESIVETVREPLVVLDEQLRVQSANRAFYQTFEFSPKTVTGKVFFAVGEGEWEIPRLKALLEQVLPHDKSFTDFEIEKEFPHLGRRTMVLNGRAVLGGDGKPISILLAIEDITQRKKLETRLRQTVAELEAFSYSVSHDLRAPLRSILGFARLVLEGNQEQLSATTRGYLQRIVAAAQHLEQLIQDILAYAQVARIGVPLAPVNLERLIAHIIDSYPDCQPPKTEIEIQRPLLPVLAHEPSLIQSISNLFSNAIKFMAPGTSPHIKVRTEAKEDQVRIWIEDNGIGIEPADSERIFTIFERVHSPKKYEGTGIGLSIVRKAVERMGGTVGVESEVGQGSKFWIQLKGIPRP